MQQPHVPTYDERLPPPAVIRPPVMANDVLVEAGAIAVNVGNVALQLAVSGGEFGLLGADPRLRINLSVMIAVEPGPPLGNARLLELAGLLAHPARIGIDLGPVMLDVVNFGVGVIIFIVGGGRGDGETREARGKNKGWDEVFHGGGSFAGGSRSWRHEQGQNWLDDSNFGALALNGVGTARSAVVYFPGKLSAPRRRP